jgi:hypothetical protein
MAVISLVAHWTRAQMVMGSSPGGKNYFIVSCRRRAVILYLTKIYSTELVYFSNIYYHTSLYGPVLIGSNVAPTSQVCASAMFVLPILEN